MTALATEENRIIVGVDSHSDTHHVAIISDYGRPIADQEFLAVGSGYRKILEFIGSHGTVVAAGVEGTGSYGAERGLATPKVKDGPVECLRILRMSRSSAMKARTITINQIRGLLVSSPDELRSRYRGLNTSALIASLSRSRPNGHIADTSYVTSLTLKTLAVRYQSLSSEIDTVDESLKEILDSYAPLLCDLVGVGTEMASQLLVTVGDNPERVHNEAQFAALTGVAPIPASSGKTSRHRLSRGGDRDANSALHHIVLVRMVSDQRTKEYVAKRTLEGKGKREIMRCLKRYVAREIYHQIFNPMAAPPIADLRPLRKQLGLTLQSVSEHLNQWPSIISRIERGHSRNDRLATAYREWLKNQLEHGVDLGGPCFKEV